MNNTRWVQHISGQGEKWEVFAEATQVWHVQSNLLVGNINLPKSEYRICEPPERWERVTGECEVRVDAFQRQQIWHEGRCIIEGATGYRFQIIEAEQILPAARVHVHAFIVEQKVQP